MKKQILFFCTLLFFSSAFPRAGDYGYWMMADSLTYPKGRGASTVLHSGKVLVVCRRLDCELYDYTIDKWTLTDSLSIERDGHELVTLHDGRALLAGNKDVNINEIFDETIGLWTLCDSFRLGPRYGGTLTVLTNGKVLCAGGAVRGRTSSSCELYDPETDTWTVVDSMATSRQGHDSVLLSDGRVLVTGGANFLTGWLSSCEVYDPIENSWDDFPPMSTSHANHKNMLLEDNRIVVLGGSSGRDDRYWEYYDWGANKWILTGRSQLPFGKNYGVDLGNGYILVANYNQFELVSTDLLYSQNFVFHKSTFTSAIGMELLPDGSVLSIDEFGQIGDVLRTTGACERYFPATTKVEKLENKGIKSFELFQNYPNPFNPTTTIHYYLPNSCFVHMAVYDVLGREVAVLVDGHRQAGAHKITWDGKDSKGLSLASGVYFYKLKGDGYEKVRKLLFVR